MTETQKRKLQNIQQQIEDLGAFQLENNKSLIEVRSDRLRQWSITIDEVLEDAAL